MNNYYSAEGVINSTQTDALLSDRLLKVLMPHQSSIAKASVTSYSPEPEAKQPENKTEEKEFESLEEALTGE